MTDRYRLYPTAMQLDGLVRHCAEARFVWNLALEQKNLYRRERGPSPGFVEQTRQLTEARADNAWLAEGSSRVQHTALRDLDAAMKAWWNGTRGHPTWRRRGRNEGFGFRHVVVRRLSRKWASVCLPKLGRVRFRLTGAVPDSPKSARVTLDATGRWHIAFPSVQPAVARSAADREVGVDRGVAVSASLSDGRMERCPQPSVKRMERLVRLQRKAARRRVRGRPPSKRLRCTRGAIAALRAREADARKDWVEKTSTMLVREHDVIVFERLRTRDMSRSARGTVEKPGSGVRQKAGLNRAIQASGWKLALRTKQKADASGVTYIEVDPRFTSQTCAACGVADAASRKSQATFVCTGCGHRANADTNAARVILARGLAVSAAGLAVAGRGDLQPIGGSVKRQPLGGAPLAPKESRSAMTGRKPSTWTSGCWSPVPDDTEGKTHDDAR